MVGNREEERCASKLVCLCHTLCERQNCSGQVARTRLGREVRVLLLIIGDEHRLRVHEDTQLGCECCNHPSERLHVNIAHCADDGKR